MLIKRPVYNQRLECVAMEIIASQQAKQHNDLVDFFATILRNTDPRLQLFIPYALKFLVEQSENPVENPLILKLHAADIGHLCPQEELENSSYAIALLIDNPQQLAWLNFAEYIALSEHLMSKADVTKVVTYSQQRQRKVMLMN